MCPRALLLPPIFILALLSIPSLAMDLGPEVETTERVVDAGDGLASHRSVAMMNGLFYVTWIQHNTLKVAIFDRDGGQLAEHTLVEGTDPFRALIINDGSRLVLLWADLTSLRISGLTEDGALVIPGGLKLRQGAYDLDFATTAGSYLVGWGNGGSRGGMILDGTFATVASFVEQGGTYRVRAASNGESYLLMWTSSQPEGLYARRVDPDGTLGAVNVVNGEAGRYTLDVAWNGSHYLAASAVQAGLSMMALDEDGVPAGNPVIAWPDATLGTSLSPHPSGFLVLAEQPGPPSGIPEGPDPSRLFSFIVSPQGERLTDVSPVSAAWIINSIPSLAGDGERYFATWLHSSGGGFAVRGTIIRGDGEVLLADNPVPGLTISRSVRSQAVESVARGDHGFLAIWSDAIRERNESSVRFARLDSDGRSLDANGIELYPLPHYSRPSLVCGRARCLVVYHTEEEGSAIDGLVGRWISLNGRSISAPFVIGPHYRSVYSGFLATDGENYATVVLSTLHIVRPDQNVDFIPIPRPSGSQLWHERLASNGDGFLLVSLYGSPALSIRALRFDADGRITNETTLPTTAGYSYEFEIASNGSEYLLVNDQLRGLRVSSSGIPVGGYVNVASARTSSLSIGWNGTHWLVAWERHDSFGLPIAVHVTKLQRYGGAVETIEVAAGGRPRIACSEDGESMVMFESWLDPQTWGSVRRVHARVIDPGSRPTPGPRRRGVRRP